MLPVVFSRIMRGLRVLETAAASGAATILEWEVEAVLQEAGVSTFFLPSMVRPRGAMATGVRILVFDGKWIMLVVLPPWPLMLVATFLFGSVAAVLSRGAGVMVTVLGGA